MEKSTGQIVAESLVIAGILTIVSYFNGGVMYPFDESVYLPPAWVQLLRNYVICFVVFFSVQLLFVKIEGKIKGNK